jgi:hypothetical protein
MLIVLSFLVILMYYKIDTSQAVLLLVFLFIVPPITLIYVLFMTRRWERRPGVILL